MSYYETLGVSRDAGPEQIKEAYRKKAMAAHPDRGGSDEQMARVNEAYECLSDPDKRARYDSSDAFLTPAERELMRAFDAAFSNAKSIARSDVIAAIRGDLTHQLTVARAQFKESCDRTSAAFCLNERIKTRDGVANMAHLLFERARADIEKITAAQSLNIKTLEDALTLLESYSDTGAPKNADLQTFGDGSTVFLSHWGSGTGSTGGPFR